MRARIEKRRIIMKSRILLLIMACILTAGSPALADTFNGSSGNSWTILQNSVVNNNGKPFWDNESMDAGYKNVGGELLMLFPGKTFKYESLGGLVDNNVFFNGAGAGQVETMIITIAGNAGYNKLYAYNIADPAQTKLIFDGTTTISGPITYAQYGFYLSANSKTAHVGDFYSGNGTGAKSSDDNSNFAFFKEKGVPGTWYVGIEDLKDNSGEKLGDYNDLIFKITTRCATVPIPGAVWLLSSGLLGLLGLRRRSVA
jgi:hypothetical protein